VGLRVDLDVVVKRKIPSPCWDLNPRYPAHNLVILTVLPWLLGFTIQKFAMFSHQKVSLFQSYLVLNTELYFPKSSKS